MPSNIRNHRPRFLFAFVGMDIISFSKDSKMTVVCVSLFTSGSLLYKFLGTDCQGLQTISFYLLWFGHHLYTAFQVVLIMRSVKKQFN